MLHFGFELIQYYVQCAKQCGNYKLNYRCHDHNHISNTYLKQKFERIGVKYCPISYHVLNRLSIFNARCSYKSIKRIKAEARAK